MQKQSLVLVLAGIFIAAILFTPIPYRQTIDVVCIPCIDSSSYKCPKCPKAGDIIWQPSIAQLIWGKLLPDQEEKTTQIDPTADWKTYINSEYGFSLKHPNLIESTNTNYPGGTDEKLIVDMYRDVQSIPGTPDYYKDSLLIDVFENKKELSLESYVKVRQKSGYTIEKESSIIIGGQRGIIQSLKYGDGFNYFIKFPNNNKILTIVRKDAKVGSFDKDFNQILSTFQFLE